MEYTYDRSKCIRQTILVCCIPVSVMVILNDGWEGRNSENIFISWQPHQSTYLIKIYNINV